MKLDIDKPKRNSALKGLFSKEQDILRANVDLAKDEEASNEEIKQGFQSFCESYEDLLDQTRLITKVSDKLQNKLNTANQTLNDKNIELQNTIDELTKARIGRKAATITLLFAVFLFIISEGFIDPIIDNYTNNNFWLSMVDKAVIALLLKPLEGFVEKWLIKNAASKRKLKLQN